MKNGVNQYLKSNKQLILHLHELHYKSYIGFNLKRFYLITVFQLS